MSIVDFSKLYLTKNEIKLLKKIAKQNPFPGNINYGHNLVQLWRLRMIKSSVDKDLRGKNITNEDEFFTNKFYTSNFQLSYIGEKYFVYRKESFIERKIPIVISIISLLLSVTTLIISILI